MSTYTIRLSVKREVAQFATAASTMRKPNLIELTSIREVSRIIQYLDPDFQNNKIHGRPHADCEDVIMLILLLGGVITCFVVMVLHVAE